MERHLHPMLVHFPIALLIISVLFDAVGAAFKRDSLREGALWLLGLGLLGGVGAVLSGDMAEEAAKKVGIAEALLDRHEIWALVTMWIFGVLFVGRLFLRNHFTALTLAIYLVIASIGIGTLSVTGYFGGDLVYEHGAGVRHAAQSLPPTESER
jgi:uncharacterized membrane protein